MLACAAVCGPTDSHASVHNHPGLFLCLCARCRHRQSTPACTVAFMSVRACAVTFVSARTAGMQAVAPAYVTSPGLLHGTTAPSSTCSDTLPSFLSLTVTTQLSSPCPHQDLHLRTSSFAPPLIHFSPPASHAPHLFTSGCLVVGLKMEHVVGKAGLLGCGRCLSVEFLDFLSGISHVPGQDPRVLFPWESCPLHQILDCPSPHSRV